MRQTGSWKRIHDVAEIGFALLAHVHRASGADFIE